MSAEQHKTEPEIRPVTIQIDPSLHLAMRDLSKKKRVHLSYLYSEAIEQFLDAQVKKTVAPKKS